MIYIDTNSNLTLEALKTYPKVSLEIVSGFAFHSFIDNCEAAILTLSPQNALGLRTGDVVFIPLPKPRIGALRVCIVNAGAVKKKENYDVSTFASAVGAMLSFTKEK